MSQQTVLEFLEEGKQYPKVLTIERTTTSKYLFYSVVRAYARRTGHTPSFFTYVKGEANQVKGLLEEHSIFAEAGALYVLEGYPLTFVDQLNLPETTYLIAETDGGELKADPFSYRIRREILKTLLTQLGMKLSLRALLNLDWTWCKDFCDFESTLRKAKLMGWTEEQIGEELKRNETAFILPLVKKSAFKDVYEIVDKFGPAWTIRQLTELLTLTTQYKALISMGFDEERAAKDLDLSWYKLQEIRETHRTLTNDDVLKMTRRLIHLDNMSLKNPELAADLLLLNAPIKLRK